MDTPCHDTTMLEENQENDFEQNRSTKEEIGGFQLKAVVKDGGQVGPVLSVSYCRCETSPSCDNLVAVLASNHLTVYDDFHWGDHVAIVAQYVDEGATMVCMAWIPGDSVSERHRRSPRIAVAKSDGTVEIVSIIDSKVVSRMEIGEDVAEIAAPGTWGSHGLELLAVRSAQGRVVLWDVRRNECVGRVCEDASAVACASDGNSLFVARQDGSVQMYSMPFKDSYQVLGCSGDDIVKKIVRVHMCVCCVVCDVSQGLGWSVQIPVQSTANNNTSLVLSRGKCFQLWNLESESYTSEWMLKGYKDQTERPCGVNDTHAILVRVCRW